MSEHILDITDMRQDRDPDLPFIYDRTYLWFLSAPLSGTTLLLKMLNTSPNISTQIDDYTKDHKGEGLTRLWNHPDWKINNWGDRVVDPDYPFPMEHIEKMYRKTWDLTKPILCDKTCQDLIIRFEQWNSYWTDKYSYAKVKYIALVRDPWTHNSNLESWFKCNEALMDILEKKEHDIMLIKYEDLCSDPRQVVFKLIKWCPDLYRIDYGNTEDFDINYACGKIEPRLEQRYVPHKLLSIRIGNMVERFNQLCTYFGYKTYDEMYQECDPRYRDAKGYIQLPKVEVGES